MTETKEVERSRIELYREQIRRDIIIFVRKNEPTTLNQIRQGVGIPWVTARNYLCELERDEKVILQNAGHIRIFSLNPEFKRKRKHEQEQEQEQEQEREREEEQ